MKRRYIIGLVMLLSPVSWGITTITYKDVGPKQVIKIDNDLTLEPCRIMIDGEKISGFQYDPNKIYVIHDGRGVGVAEFRLRNRGDTQPTQVTLRAREGKTYAFDVVGASVGSKDVLINIGERYGLISHPKQYKKAKYPFKDAGLQKLVEETLNKANSYEAEQITFAKGTFRDEPDLMVKRYLNINGLILVEFIIQVDPARGPLNHKAFFEKYKNEVMGKRVLSHSPHHLEAQVVLSPRAVEKMIWIRVLL